MSLWHGVLTALVLFGIIAGGPLVSLATARGAETPTAEARYRLKTVKLNDGERVVARWNPCQTAITYRTNLTGVPAGRRAAVLTEIRSAVDRLGDADGLAYRYAGATSFVPRTANLPDAPAELVIAVVDARDTDLDLAESSIGFGGVLWATWAGQTGQTGQAGQTGQTAEGAAVVRGYVVLNPEGFLALTPGFGSGTTQGNAILHELGHATGLEHVRSTAEVMDAELTSKAPAGYGPGDREALRQAGRTGGCLPVPASVGVPDLA